MAQVYHEKFVCLEKKVYFCQCNNISIYNIRYNDGKGKQPDSCSCQEPTAIRMHYDYRRRGTECGWCKILVPLQ